jgi:beta-lactamase superfamily II metal-dependent hydrolase
MSVIHFLNVGDGDCSIIEHNSGHITVIDVSCAKTPRPLTEHLMTTVAKSERGVYGNFNQKKYPTNPISYMHQRGLASVFRFILTHPDMDHMDGIEAFFKEFAPVNFWDTDNAEEKSFDDGSNGDFQEDDWWFYKGLRDERPKTDPKRLALHSGAAGQYWNRGENSEPGGDGLQILAPTTALVAAACDSGDYNDCSYVILYRTGNWKILFAGDSHDATWEQLLATHKAAVTNVDILIAPHHGRDSERDWEFLDVVNPRLTFFGNAKSEHLAYQAWSNRDLSIITNNQAGNIIVSTNTDATPPLLHIYVTCEAYARSVQPNTFYAAAHDAYYWGSL